MSYLIDTCALSEFTKLRPAPSVDHWFASTPETSQFVSVLSLGELEKGIYRLPPSRRRASLAKWLAQLSAGLSERTLAVTEAVAREWGRTSARAELAGRPIPVVDALIGATALVNDLTVVTRNTSDIGRSGAKILDPWHIPSR
jgi:predicted nucleic acid-binding protein